MALGTTAGVIGTEKTVTAIFDTGEIVNEKPVLKRVRYQVQNSADVQDVYDSAYAIAEYTQYSIYGIELGTVEEIGPID